MYAYHDGGHILMILGITRHGSLEMKIAQRYKPSLSPIECDIRSCLNTLQFLHKKKETLNMVGAKHVYAVETSEMLAYACKLTVVTTIDHLSTKLWFESILPHLLQIRLSVEVPPAMCEDCYKRVMNEFMKQSKVMLRE
ncbi:uncharacterized protein LOC114269095 [Camellia sinensis]|uniref:uncharacterized protein LOC114269095 n=1 Tax=Camellia sinensis TaxID=4442 RepID=UPI001036ED65|nr:uncharacterized protein LOC114269095 [Camellia sinensis]XP_028066165.1 uncharacterized protein LOC114269095 [Camellia sinensis]